MESSEKLILLKGGEGLYEEKKSRFIATAVPVSSEEEAMNFIASTKKKYWDARHNCSAFIIGERGQLTRCSDDGEPSGTAGRPMLEVLSGAGLTNVCVVVTRYFGGTLLGTGGLVRAYTQAVKDALDNSIIGRVSKGVLIEVILDYNDVGSVKYLLEKNDLDCSDVDYAADVTMRLRIKTEAADSIEKDITECTAGRCLITRIGECEIVENI
ncbi:MAG: YigZ family protein [Lachnospiraceae bacterium]|nr:YigZ family protein [Lachnospiraceae bacterium]